MTLEPAGEELARRLRVDPGAPVLRQLVAGPGPEVAPQRSQAALHPDTQREVMVHKRDLAREDLLAVLRAKGVAAEATEDVVRARMPSPGEREEPVILDAIPVSEVVRTVQAQGRTAAVIETVVAADLVSLRYSLPSD